LVLPGSLTLCLCELDAWSQDAILQRGQKRTAAENEKLKDVLKLDLNSFSLVPARFAPAAPFSVCGR
jgi:hypothetical protein